MEWVIVRRIRTREKKGNKNTNERDYNQQFDEREVPSKSHGSLSFGASPYERVGNWEPPILRRPARTSFVSVSIVVDRPFRRTSNSAAGPVPS
jgi:hypothetical protein